MKLIDRLKAYIENKGISYNAFDKSIGAANGYIGKQIKNEASIGSDIIEKILSIYTDLSPTWLLLGKDEIESKTDLSKTIEEPQSPPYQRKCLMCEEKEKRIKAMQALIEAQNEIIYNLKDTIKSKQCSPSNESGQKRKAV